EFNPRDFKDEYRKALMKVIEAKVEGKETFTRQEPEEPTKLVDLMAALEASVAATKSSRADKGKPVSVAEARERSAKRAEARKLVPQPAAEKARPTTRRRAAAKAAAPEEAEEARPARRRKSA